MKYVDGLFDHTLPLVRSVLDRLGAPAPISTLVGRRAEDSGEGEFESKDEG